MGFPKEDYIKAIAELQATVWDRDAKGRNETNDFYSQFPHGNQDLTFELKRRVERILGAEKIGAMETVYGDTLDLANYAIFSLMLLKRAKTSSASSPAQPVAESRPLKTWTPVCIQLQGSKPLGQGNGSNTHPPAEYLDPSYQGAGSPCTENWYNPS